jgi:sialidase-1
VRGLVSIIAGNMGMRGSSVKEVTETESAGGNEGNEGTARKAFLLAAKAGNSHSNGMIHRFLIFLLAGFLGAGWFSRAADVRVSDKTSVGVRKVGDLVIYRDDKFYSSFPSVVRRPNGELLVAFRRAPERRALGERNTSHTDPNSYLMLVRSRDEGKTWSHTPELIYANPLGGSQDPCMVQLRDGSIVCTSYGWTLLQEDAAAKLRGAYRHGSFVFLGGYLVRSTDGGHAWQGPIFPPPTPGETVLGPYGQPVPAYNRGAMCQARDGNLYWVVASKTSTTPGPAGTHLLVSSDKGARWSYACPVASDSKVGFNETSLYETPKGDLVAFMRTANGDDHTAAARSTDHGKSFEHWQDAGFQGHPHYALRLPDQRVLLVYGYRHPPFGIRARVLDAECTNVASAPEITLRDDGGSNDLGYPWATLLSKHRALVVYYFNVGGGIRHIAGTVVALD